MRHRDGHGARWSLAGALAVSQEDGRALVVGDRHVRAAWYGVDPGNSRPAPAAKGFNVGTRGGTSRRHG